MERTDLVLSEINQSQKDKYQVSAPVCFQFGCNGFSMAHCVERLVADGLWEGDWTEKHLGSSEAQFWGCLGAASRGNWQAGLPICEGHPHCEWAAPASRVGAWMQQKGEEEKRSLLKSRAPDAVS